MLTALGQHSTATEHSDLALEIAQHDHLKGCELCQLHLAEISPDVLQPWARQTLNALAHRCNEHERFHGELTAIHLRIDALQAPTPRSEAGE
jgi:hypothetical protein